MIGAGSRSAPSGVPTTPRLIQDLKEVDYVTALLRATADGDLETLGDLAWLLKRRRDILAVLAARREQRGRKIASLDAWRGDNTPDRSVAEAA